MQNLCMKDFDGFHFLYIKKCPKLEKKNKYEKQKPLKTSFSSPTEGWFLPAPEAFLFQPPLCHLGQGELRLRK